MPRPQWVRGGGGQADVDSPHVRSSTSKHAAPPPSGSGRVQTATHLCVHGCMFATHHTPAVAWTYVCMCACMHACMVCMHACMHGMHVCMCVCMYVCVVTTLQPWHGPKRHESREAAHGRVDLVQPQLVRAIAPVMLCYVMLCYVMVQPQLVRAMAPAATRREMTTSAQRGEYAAVVGLRSCSGATQL